MFVVLISVCTHLESAPLMPGLKKMREKLEKALECPPVTLKDLMQTDCCKNLQIAPSGVRFVSVSNAYSGDMRIKDAQEKMKLLYWSLQHDVIISLKQTAITDKNQALVIIKDVMHKKYAGLKSPLLLFAKDLDHEEQVLKKLDQEVTKLLLATDVRSDQELLKVVKAMLVDVKTAIGDLQDLIGCVNSLLMG